MLLTYQEALKRYGTRYRILKAISEEELIPVERNCYATEDDYDSLEVIMKKYPETIVTGLSAYYLHGLTDVIPSAIDIATRRNGTTINDDRVIQHFIPAQWVGVGMSALVHDGVTVVVYDLERMLLELARNRNKMPYDIYKEVVSSYRRRADEVDIYKLQDYAAKIPRGDKYLAIALKEVF